MSLELIKIIICIGGGGGCGCLKKLEGGKGGKLGGGRERERERKRGGVR